jgi:hypothetical protein
MPNAVGPCANTPRQPCGRAQRAALGSLGGWPDPGQPGLRAATGPKGAGNEREQRQLRQLQPRAEWGQITAALERAKQEKWDEFAQQHGDWGRDAALWLDRKFGRLTLRELGQLVGGIEYPAVAQAVGRFGRRLERAAQVRKKTPFYFLRLVACGFVE